MNYIEGSLLMSCIRRCSLFSFRLVCKSLWTLFPFLALMYHVTCCLGIPYLNFDAQVCPLRDLPLETSCNTAVN